MNSAPLFCARPQLVATVQLELGRIPFLLRLWLHFLGVWQGSKCRRTRG